MKEDKHSILIAEVVSILKFALYAVMYRVRYFRRSFIYYVKLSAAALLAIALWLIFVFASAFYGWWMNPISPPGDTEDFFQQATAMLVAANRGNAALLMIEDGSLVAEYYSSFNDSIDKDTVFLTASMSKWLTAVGIMKLVEDGDLDLDTSISSYLTRWELPESEFDNSEVTVRRLLSHTAGFTDGLGFGDYKPEESLPTLEESLSNPRASSDRNVEIAVGLQPGSAWRYSGGSYLILQLLLEEVSGVSFQQYMNEVIFAPLDMERSSYRYIGDVENNAGSYGNSGEAAPLYQYASGAATGFATSSLDLSRFVLSQIPNAGEHSVLNQGTIESMRVPHGSSLGFDIWGLGTILYAPTSNGDFVFGHDGANDPAINSTARINPTTGDAIIVLETGHPSLATNIGSQWVLWQTGYPDVLDTDSVFESMVRPALLGTGVILFLAVSTGFVRSRKRL